MKRYLMDVISRSRKEIEQLSAIVRRMLLSVRQKAGEQAQLLFGIAVKLGQWITDRRETLGYYVVLILVLVALAAGAYDYRSRKTAEDMIGDLPVYDPGITVQMQPDPTLEPQNKTEEAFILPVRGTVVGAFSDDELIWSSTMQLWQTHPAVDIAANIGEAVVAAADGTVAEAYSDALYGNVIVIDHGGCTVRYASLNTLQMVEVGQRVQKGDVIGSVGTCIAESEHGGHVHLECYVDQHAEDFLGFISEDDRSILQD